MTDKVIVQAPQISVAALKAIAEGHDGPLTININVGNMNASINEEAPKKEIEVFPRALPMDDEALLAYIETFPEPRLKNFIEHLYTITIQRLGATGASRWLGVSTRTSYNHRQILHDNTEEEKSKLIEALKESKGNVRRAAFNLGLPYTTVIQRVRRWRILDLWEEG